MTRTAYRRIANRQWSFNAPTAEAAMDAMEAEMGRLGHRVITHEEVERKANRRWRVRSLIEMNA